MSAKRILVGEIGRPHGVRGLVKLRSFTADPDDIVSYGALTDATGTRAFALTLLSDGVAKVDGITDRDAAAKLTGTQLYVERDRLPPPEEDEFYLADLAGLRAETEDGQPLGIVRVVEDFSAGAILVIDGPGGERMIPFTRACVPVVEIAAGRVVVVPPDEIVVQPQPGEEDAA